MKYLQWYRDKGNGQQAATALHAEELIDFWPIARLPFTTEAERETIWQTLLKKFQVNAMAYYCS